MKLAYNLHFDRATETFDELIKLKPDNPRGYLLQAVNFYYRHQLEENSEVFAKQFVKLATTAIERSKSKLGNKEQRLDALFYLGTANMYLAAYHGWQSNWLRAYWYGKDGIGYLERVIAADSTYYDAYLGLGLYHYYTDVIPKIAKAVTFLLGFEADRQKGLEELELAAAHGKYSRAEALLFLGSIHLYVEKDYEKSRQFFEELARLYPENASYSMLLGEAYQKLGKNEQAAQTLHQLVDQIPQPPRFPVLVSSSFFRLGNVYYNMRELPQAIKYYQDALKHATQSTGEVQWIFALANLNLGRSYDLIGKRDIALEYYRRVKKSDHKHAHKIAKERIKTPLVRSKRRVDGNNFDEIIDIFQNAMAKTKADTGKLTREKMPELNFHIAKSLYDKGAYKSAIARFERILGAATAGEDWLKPRSLFYLGKCYVQLGESNKASRAFDLAYKFENEQLRLEIDQARKLLASGAASSESPSQRPVN